MIDDDNDKIKIDLKWLDEQLANINGTTQFDLFTNQGAATITGAAGSSNPYHINVSNGTGGSYTFQGPSSNVNNNWNQIWTSNGTGGLTSQPYNVNADYNWNINPGLHVKGNAEFEGDVKIKGKSITEMFEKIEEKLAILHPNEELEAKWEKLRELRKQYIECEKDILEKEKIWEILKK